MESEDSLCILLRRMKPCARGSTSNPFFATNEERSQAPSSAGKGREREVGIALPPALVPLYASHPPDTEFESEEGGIVFLSEDEMRERGSPPEALDFAYRYAGMGHVRVFTHIFGKVVGMIDGGANGYDREANSAARKKKVEALLEEGKGTNGRCDEGVPFREWCEAELTQDQWR